MIRVTVLGSGTVDPVPSRASSGFHLQIAQRQIVVDLGGGTLRNAVSAGLDIAQLDTVVLTHFHPDHTSDLVPFLFARKYATGDWRLSPSLTLYGPRGTGEFLDRIFSAWPSVRPEAQTLHVVELAPGERYRLLEDTSLEVFTAVHGDMEALSLRFSIKDKVVAFSGDTALCPGVVQAAQRADLFFCECSCFPRGEEPLYCRTVHLAWEDVAEICASAQPRELVVTHLYEPVVQRKPNPGDSLSQVLRIPVTLASDLAVFEVA